MTALFGVVVEDATGRILWRTSEGAQTGIGAQQFVVEGEFDAATVWFVDGEPQPRPMLFETAERAIAADGVTEVVLELPAGTNVFSIEDREDARAPGRHRTGRVPVVAEGSIEFSTSKPGVYVFEIEPPFPYQAQTVTITATEVGA